MVVGSRRGGVLALLTLDVILVFAHTPMHSHTCHITPMPRSMAALFWRHLIGQEAKPSNFRLARTDYLQRCLKPDR